MDLQPQTKGAVMKQFIRRNYGLSFWLATSVLVLLMVLFVLPAKTAPEMCPVCYTMPCQCILPCAGQDCLTPLRAVLVGATWWLARR
jgi:hypothetical protein